MAYCQKIEFSVHYPMHKETNWVNYGASTSPTSSLLIILRKIKSIPSPKLHESPKVLICSLSAAERVFCMSRTHLNPRRWLELLLAPGVFGFTTNLAAKIGNAAAVLSFLLIFDASIIQSLGISHTQRPRAAPAHLNSKQNKMRFPFLSMESTECSHKEPSSMGMRLAQMYISTGERWDTKRRPNSTEREQQLLDLMLSIRPARPISIIITPLSVLISLSLSRCPRGYWWENAFWWMHSTHAHKHTTKPKLTRKQRRRGDEKGEGNRSTLFVEDKRNEEKGFHDFIWRLYKRRLQSTT